MEAKARFSILAWSAFSLAVASALLAVWSHNEDFGLTAGILVIVAVVFAIGTTDNNRRY